MTVTENRISESLVKTLPGSAYSDPELFAREQELIFERMWFCAASSADIGKAGSFRTVQIGRESILLTRSRKGEARGYFNICRHRGAKLCTEESGEGARSFQCPYHAWTYDLEGKLIAAPEPHQDARHRPVRLRAAQGPRPRVARVRLGQPGRGAAPVRGDRHRRRPDPPGRHRVTRALRRRDLALGKRITYDVKANWKLIIENFMECYHCATIHPELTEVLPEFADGFAAQYFVGHGAEFARHAQGFTVDGSEGHERLPASPPTRTAATTR
jgi:Rieske 2Fe-2S family protein